MVTTASLTHEHIEKDLARKPPPLPTAALAAGRTHSSVKGLALVLLHQQLQALAGMLSQGGGDDKTQGIEVKKELQRTKDELLSMTADIDTEEETEEEQQQQDFQTAEAWAEALAKEDDDEEEEDQDEEDDNKTTNATEVKPKERYLDLLTKHRVLPVCIPLSSSHSPTGNDDTDHQSMRDIERDSLIVNGAAYQPGGLGGHTRVLLWLQEVMKCQLEGVGCPLAKITSSESLEAFVKQVLRHINRTNSAGAAYDIMSERLGIEGVNTIVPDSKAAEPLSIYLDAAAFPLDAKGEEWAWGLRARLQTATSYICYDEAAEEEWLRVRAEYRETVCLPLVMTQSRAAKNREVRSLGATVRLSQRPAAAAQSS